jgi:WD40 repeat protein
LETGAKWAERVAWSADGSLLASAAGKIVRIWNAGSGELIRENAGHASTVADIAWHPRKNELAVAAYGGVTIYDPANSEPVKLWPYKGSPLKLSWSPSGLMLAHGNQDSSVHFRYAETDEELHMSGYIRKVRELSWDFKGRYLVTGGGPGACIWDCAGNGPAGTTPKILEGQSAFTSAVAWQNRGFLIATGDASGRFCVWQPVNRTPLIGAGTFSDTEISGVAWSPDDKLLAVGSGAGALGVFKVN